MTAYDALNPKHRKFVDEFLIDLHGTHAAIRAGYPKGRARITASELLRREDVAAALAEKQAEQSADAQARGRDARAEIEAMAFMNCGPLLSAVPPALLRVKLEAATVVLKLDGKFTEKVEHSGVIRQKIEGDDNALNARIAELGERLGLKIEGLG